jgi:hypothetical protein
MKGIRRPGHHPGRRIVISRSSCDLHRSIYISPSNHDAERRMTDERRIFTFDTTHHALWAEEVAGERGIAAEVIPAPPAAHARCNLAIETFPEDAERLESALSEEGVPFALYRSSSAT